MTGHEAPPVNHLGGSIYGDGEYVVTFVNVRSTSPMRAHGMTPDGGSFEAGPFSFGKPSVKLATEIIAEARRKVASEEAERLGREASARGAQDALNGVKPRSGERYYMAGYRSVT